MTSSRLLLVAAVSAAALTAAPAHAVAAPAGSWVRHLLGDENDKAPKVQATADAKAQTPDAKSGAPAAAAPGPAVTPAGASEDAGKKDASGKPDTSAKKHIAGKPAARAKDGGSADGDAPAKLAPVAPPVAGKRVAATVTAGTVRVRVAGTDTYLPLGHAASVPVGSVIDARHGDVVVRAKLPGMAAEAGTFSGGMFQVRQSKGLTVLRLRGGDFGRCAADHSLMSVGKRQPTVVRRLWGSDHGGHFRTHGHNSVATVRGTRWLTEDRCHGTLTRVVGGAVSVYDRHTRKTVLVRAGHSYFARQR